jgi:hypothetical protein
MYWLVIWLQKYISEIPFLALSAVHPSESIFYIPFCHKDFCIIVSLCKGMDNPAEAITDLVYRPPGAVFVVVALTTSLTPPCFNLIRNERSRIDRKAFDLCGIAAIGEIFYSLGGLSFMVSHSMTLAWFVHTFSLIS